MSRNWSPGQADDLIDLVLQETLGENDADVAKILHRSLSIGLPTLVKLRESDFDEERWQELIREAGPRANFYLLHIAFTLNPQDGKGFESCSLECRATYDEGGAEGPVAWRMIPFRSTRPLKTDSSWTIGAKVGLFSVENKRSMSVEEEFIDVRAYYLRESAFMWKASRGIRGALDGSEEFMAILMGFSDQRVKVDISVTASRSKKAFYKGNLSSEGRIIRETLRG